MSTTYDTPVFYGPPPPPPPPPRRARGRVGRAILATVVAVVVAICAFLGLRATFAPAARTGTLTTSEIARRVDRGLVDIVTTLGYQHAAAAGTGMVLTPRGEVLTNNHVIEGATSISVTDVGNGRTYRARVVGYDRSHDVAVLQLIGAAGLQTVTTGNSATVSIGQRVVAIGNALGKGGTPSVVTGRVTGLGASITASDSATGTSERLTGLITHNAPIKPGDSGGPLVSRAGRVIGINTAASSTLQFQSSGRAFAIPISEALSVASAIESGKGSATVHIGATGFLGVAVASQQQAVGSGIPAGSGALVAGTLPGTPASRAGIAAGDVIVSAGGHRVRSPLGLQAALQLHHPGDSVAIGWIDPQGHRHSAAVVLINGPAG